MADRKGHTFHDPTYWLRSAQAIKADFALSNSAVRPSITFLNALISPNAEIWMSASASNRTKAPRARDAVDSEVKRVTTAMSSGEDFLRLAEISLKIPKRLLQACSSSGLRGLNAEFQAGASLNFVAGAVPEVLFRLSCFFLSATAFNHRSEKDSPDNGQLVGKHTIHRPNGYYEMPIFCVTYIELYSLLRMPSFW